MAKSTKSRRANKPTKPHPDFPLFPHATGLWAKKVRGKMRYFGPWGDLERALNRWLDEKDDLLASRSPREDTGGLTVKELADQFLTLKLSRVKTGELSAYSYRDYVKVLQHMADFFGKTRSVTDLRPADFEALRNSFAKTHGPARLAKDVTVVRSLFKYADGDDLIEHPIKLGLGFKPPKRDAMKKASRASGRKDFSAEELRAILDAATMPLRAMVLLGINAGLGNTDVGELPESAIEGKFLVYPRVKTQVDRRTPMWPETFQAVREAIESRPKAKDSADADCVFLTKYGRRWCRLNADDDPAKRTRVDAIGLEFRKLLKSLSINGRRGFYSLRHTFETQAGESRDQVAVDCIMGHVDPSMAATYRHSISDQRLLDVVAVVHRWLWPDAANAEADKS